MIKPCPVLGCNEIGTPCEQSYGYTLRCPKGQHASVTAPTVALAIRAWNSLSAPTDRRCGTCAAWGKVGGESSFVGECRADPLLTQFIYFMTEKINGHDDEDPFGLGNDRDCLTHQDDGGWCAKWRLRGAE